MSDPVTREMTDAEVKIFARAAIDLVRLLKPWREPLDQLDPRYAVTAMATYLGQLGKHNGIDVRAIVQLVEDTYNAFPELGSPDEELLS